ncbi:isoprenylcysteine carboxylmethyltransferase family protein [Candidatus Micrarchaeota archaeon]|nr:isoprenylcysteine carboxylmethyltransferase family protein [Candidatus Micrarchaeota archaeon]
MEIDKKTVNRAFQVLFGLALMAASFFLAAGRLDIPRAWFLYGMSLVQLLCNFVIFWKFAPGVMAERSEMKPGMKSWDKAFAVGYILSVVAIHAVAGFDIGRAGWSDLGETFGAFGVALYVIGAIIIAWAMVVNKFFETTVTIVKGHQVMTGGPYAIVRHPGYAGMILMYGSASLVLGSAVSLIPAAILALLFVGRTYMEDKTLQEELKGYKEYMKKVRYRLVPGIW